MLNKYFLALNNSNACAVEIFALIGDGRRAYRDVTVGASL